MSVPERPRRSEQTPKWARSTRIVAMVTSIVGHGAALCGGVLLIVLPREPHGTDIVLSGAMGVGVGVAGWGLLACLVLEARRRRATRRHP